ncbi:O-antigen polymerase [Butyrivibrio proteoclasticus]|uniref:O-antigen polymerase n=1 Tax=Butyrivibrio proteoclasticus TaxID=43305 RepID=UPI00047A37ED|nr:O-antigen polymerase [Butyrivibrio proteoclasticus]
MFGICIITIFVLIIVNYIFRKNMFNEVTFILLFWLVSVITNKFGNIVYYEISNKTYLVIMIGLSTFTAGNLWQTVYCSRHKKGDEKGQSIINWQVLYVFLVIHFLSSLNFLLSVFEFLSKEYSFLQIREIYQGYIEGVSFTNNYFEKITLHWIAQPLSILLMIITLVLLINNDYSHKKFILLVIIDELLYFFYTQSRTSVFYIVVCLVVLYANNRRFISALQRKRIRSVVAFIILGITIWTIVKFSDSKNWNGLKTYELYLGGGVSLLDYGIIKIDSKGFYSKGVNFFYGVYTIFYHIYYLLPVTKSDFNRNIVTIHAFKENFVRIGPKVWFNAYYSFFYDFYIDGGVLAVAIECLLYGVISSKNIIEMRLNKYDVEKQCKGLLMCIVVFMGVVRWQFVSPVFVFVYVYMFLIFHFKLKIRNVKVNV